MQAKPNVILHVGMDKTGTSAIQFALEAAHDRLREDHGILVPRTGLWHDFSHHPFAFATFGMAGYAKTDLPRLFAELRKEIARTPCKTVLLTSECLFKVPFRKAQAEFMENLRDIFDQIRVVIYVRRQDIWIESRYRHSVISGRELNVQRLRTRNFSDYLQFIESWSDLVGAENVTVRPYEVQQFPQGDIAADFQSVLGLPAGSLPSQRDNRHNVTFHADAVLLRAALNHLALPALQSSELNRLLLDIPVSPEAPKATFLAPVAALAVIKTYSDVNTRIARKYLGRDTLFLDPLPTAEKGWVPPELSAQRMVELLTYLQDCDALLVSVIAAKARAALISNMPSGAAAKAVWGLLEGLETLKGTQVEPIPVAAVADEDLVSAWKTEAAPKPGFDPNRLLPRLQNAAREALLTLQLGLRRLRRRSARKPGSGAKPS